MSFPLTFDDNEYIEFLRILIADTEKLQNGGGFVAQETLAANHVIDRLRPYIDSGLIKCTKVEYVEGRANLILEYGNSESGRTVTFAGSHFDCVPANPAMWNRNPFELVVEGDKLWGRATTDCLGHVALTTLILEKLAKNNVQLNYELIVIYIANEEDGRDTNIGAEHLLKDGYFEQSKNGCVYWLDASDVEPVRGSGSGLAWTLKVTGKKAHTGFVHQGINPIPIAYEAMKAIIGKFNELYPRTEKDDEYNYRCSANMKPTIMNTSPGNAANQFPDFIEITGDVRMPAYWNAFDMKVKILEFAESLDLDSLPKLHEHFTTSCDESDTKVYAKMEFKWIFGPYCGIVTDVNSIGYKMIENATLQHHPTCNACSELGAIPLVKEMQDSGMDIQIIGYGNVEAYHANNEFCTLSGMKKGFNILKSLLEIAQNK